MVTQLINYRMSDVWWDCVKGDVKRFALSIMMHRSGKSGEEQWFASRFACHMVVKTVYVYVCGS